MMKNIKHYAVTVVIIFVILIINVMAYFQYSGNISEELEEHKDIHLQSMIEDIIDCINIKLEERLVTLEAVATFIGTESDIKNDRVVSALTKQAQTAGYNDFDVITSDAKGLDNKSDVDYTDNKNYLKALGGKSVFDIKTDAFGAINGIECYVPIYGGGKIVGVLKAESTLEQFTKYMDISDLGQYGNVFVVKQDGTLLSRGYGLDEVENISMVFDDKKVASDLLNSMQSRQSGYISYDTGNSMRYICYARSNYNKWYMVSIMSASAISVSSDDIANEGTVFFMEIAILTSILTIYLIRAVFAESQNNLMNKKRYYLVSKYTDRIIFDYSCKKDTMYCNENWQKIFGYEVERSKLKEDITRHIADEDKERFTEIVNVLIKEKEFVRFQVGIKNSQGEIINCSVRMSALKGKKGKMQKVLGIIEVCSHSI